MKPNNNTIRISDNTLDILKKAKEDLNVSSYDKAIFELSKKSNKVKLSDSVVKQLKQQASLTLWDSDEYLRIVLDFYKSEASHRKD